jgi:hypothetical protein
MPAAGFSAVSYREKHASKDRHGINEGEELQGLRRRRRNMLAGASIIRLRAIFLPRWMSRRSFSLLIYGAISIVRRASGRHFQSRPIFFFFVGLG